VREGQFPFHGRSGGETQACADIFQLKIRIFSQNFALPHPAGQQPQDGSNRNSLVAHTRDSTHLCRIYRNSLEILHGRPLIIVASDAPSRKRCLRRPVEAWRKALTSTAWSAAVALAKLTHVMPAASRFYLFGFGAGGWIKSGTAPITRGGVNFNFSCSVKNAILSRRASAFSACGAS
jgi:hypothetical protein